MVAQSLLYPDSTGVEPRPHINFWKTEGSKNEGERDEMLRRGHKQKIHKKSFMSHVPIMAWILSSKIPFSVESQNITLTEINCFCAHNYKVLLYEGQHLSKLLISWKYH